MGRTEPPFLYDPPQKHEFQSHPWGNFNPKAVTMEYAAPRRPRPRKNAPLINFNQHDPYLAVSTGRVGVKTMSPRTKGKVKYTRYVLLLVRLLTLVGALGILFCVICIKNTTKPVAWMIRVAPGVSILHTIYGIYHLSRRAHGRTPGSSAGYMLFSAVLDAGLIPFYVFTSIMSNVEHRERQYEWSTLFETAIAFDKIVYSTFLATAVVGGLHLAALIMDLYLAIIFRKIAKLPPDMNPLEDNLTSRAHKRSKSEIAEKHLSGSTAVSSNRDSVAQDPFMFPTHQMPFMHTRKNSDFPEIEDERSSYYSAQSHRYSRSDLPSQVFRQYEQATQPKPAIARTAAQRRGSRPQSMVMDRPMSSGRAPPQSVEHQSRDTSGVSSLAMDMDNWVVYPSDEQWSSSHTERDVSPINSRPSSPQNDLTYSPTVRRSQGLYAPLRSFEDDDGNIYDRAHTENLYGSGHEQDLAECRPATPDEDPSGGRIRLLINPLELNPPTPRPPEPADTAESCKSKGSIRRVALADLPNPSSSGRSTPVNSPNGKKLRSYGNLGQDTPPAKREAGGSRNNTPTPSKSGTKTWWRRSGGAAEYASLKAEDNDSDQEDEGLASPGETDRKGRVVSNTGVDLGLGLGPGSQGYSNYIAGLGVGRKRDVSGKLVEEGRSGTPGEEDGDTAESATKSATKPRKLSKTGDFKAAGWARWKGL